MVELGLVFLLGMLVAGLVWLILLPAFWRRAVRLTTERVEQALPLTINEIRAEHDRLRAEHAVEAAAMRARLEAAERGVLEAKAETGERLRAEAGFHRRLASDLRRIGGLEAEIDSLKTELRARDARIEELIEARDFGLATITGLEAQRDALTDRLGATYEIAERRRLALDEARIMAERAREALAEEGQRSAKLRADLTARQAELREAERRLATIDNSAILTRIRGGEETYQSTLPLVDIRQRQAR